MSLRVIRGKVLRETPVTAEIRLILFRNDEKKEFEIQVQLPSDGYLYTLSHRLDGKTSLKDYEELLEKLKISKSGTKIPNMF